MLSDYPVLAATHRFLQQRLWGRGKGAGCDLCLLLSEYNRGWVLETICRQIAQHWPASTRVVWTRRNRKITARIPPARVYWFSHFQLLVTALEQNPEVMAGRLMVWFTHPSKPEISEERLVAALNQCHAVIFTCSLHREDMVAKGVRPEISHVVLGGADPAVFRPTPGVARDCIGFVSAYYERKRPELKEAIVQTMPERRFLLVGPRARGMKRKERLWTRYDGFGRLASLPNLDYVEASHKDYPALFSRMTHLISTSSLEGGPISAIEALFCGCRVVLSETGFARDLVRIEPTVEVVPLEANAAAYAEAVERAERPAKGVRNPLDWASFAGRIWALSQGRAELETAHA